MTLSNKPSQKCVYALKAIFELSLRDSDQPVNTHDIAVAQAIPTRFLEVILAELKHGGFVESKRGNDGGYLLAATPANISVGQIIDFLHGTNGKKKKPQNADLVGNYAFNKLWDGVNTAIAEIYNGTSFADLVEQEVAHRKTYVPNYAI